MKQIKHGLLIMFLSLIYINIIEEINSSNLKSLYYSNSDLTNFKGKSFTKICKKEKNCKGINLDKLPVGFKYFPAPNNNVYLRTINFYIRFLKMIGDRRDFGSLSINVSRNCNNFNIFKDIRESVLNCRAISRSIKKDRSNVKTFYIRCMANLLRIVKNKCPDAFDKNTSLRNLNWAIIKLTKVDKRFIRRFQVNANIFIKKLSFFMKVFSPLIKKRFAYFNKLRDIAKKKAAAKRAKLNKMKKSKGKNKGKKEKKKLNKRGLKCPNKCKKRKVCIKICKKSIEGKITVRRNTKADNKFAKDIGLNSFKGQAIASLFGRWVKQIIHT